MATIEHVKLSELHDLLQSLKLPPETRLTIAFEDDASVLRALKRRNAGEAMKKLKGSGNGNLVTALMAERKKDSLL